MSRAISVNIQYRGSLPSVSITKRLSGHFRASETCNLILTKNYECYIKKFLNSWLRLPMQCFAIFCNKFCFIWMFAFHSPRWFLADYIFYKCSRCLLFVTETIGRSKGIRYCMAVNHFEWTREANFTKWIPKCSLSKTLELEWNKVEM